jgi:hypothetical protein
VIEEHEYETVRGLPAALPPGETILWQGSPDWRGLAARVFHLKGLAAYFALLAAWRCISLYAEGAAPLAVLQAGIWAVMLGASTLIILAAIARAMAGSAIYTITNRRVVLRVGVALPMIINLPFSAVTSAGLRLGSGGQGDLVLRLAPPHRVYWLALWPHARPWRFGYPQPMLRSVPDAEAVAQILARALAASAGSAVPEMERTGRRVNGVPAPVAA